MAFTYTGTPDSVERDFVRFHIDDKIGGEGPLPNAANFTDEELDGILAIEGTKERAVAACLEALSQAWVKFPSFSADGLQYSRSHIARNYADMAKEWRNNYGTRAGGSVGSRSVIRVDGYSDDIASDTVT